MGRRRWTSRDLCRLREALDLAARGGGQASPNPMVGAVLAHGNRIVGRGYHTRAGAPHAEIKALEQAGRRARGATLYVNLEPCCHFGRTPPCVDALIAAGVSEVVACMRDPDRRVDGKGFRALRAAGVSVRVGALRSRALNLNRRFLHEVRRGLPFVTLKAGMSLDGRIATRGGQSKWITSPRARAAARLLRSRHDAVLVGVNTVLADDPRLRGPGAAGRRSPARVVLDARLRTPRSARILRGGGETIIFTLGGASVVRKRALERAGAIVVQTPGRGGRLRLKAVLGELARRGVRSVLVEGGSEVLGSALDQKIGDGVVLFVAGTILGGRGALPAFGGLGPARLGEAVRIEDLVVRRVGPDLMVRGRLRFPAPTRRRRN
ncbi:MAG: bifunctional diaminohydroxyphosphoribosylaminopyrimidine deaminase/5-amino-6-(5-phosphoribosylamino)uracil reductase RibD [Acidobacteria bacterium]|nr:bifunctional diaminohydroxyphosphoribosylaminopyrimidine deaminase/5-amino-6-(5-phosphoribosylamino)uracil reductase RibD [Acidobacteriota bacterium]